MPKMLLCCIMRNHFDIMDIYTMFLIYFHVSLIINRFSNYIHYSLELLPFLIHILFFDCLGLLNCCFCYLERIIYLLFCS